MVTNVQISAPSVQTLQSQSSVASSQHTQQNQQSPNPSPPSPPQISTAQVPSPATPVSSVPRTLASSQVAGPPTPRFQDTVQYPYTDPKTGHTYLGLQDPNLTRGSFVPGTIFGAGLDRAISAAEYRRGQEQRQQYLSSGVVKLAPGQSAEDYVGYHGSLRVPNLPSTQGFVYGRTDYTPATNARPSLANQESITTINPVDPYAKYLNTVLPSGNVLSPVSYNPVTGIYSQGLSVRDSGIAPPILTLPQLQAKTEINPRTTGTYYDTVTPFGTITARPADTNETFVQGPTRNAPTIFTGAIQGMLPFMTNKIISRQQNNTPDLGFFPSVKGQEVVAIPTAQQVQQGTITPRQASNVVFYNQYLSTSQIGPDTYSQKAYYGIKPPMEENIVVGYKQAEQPKTYVEQLSDLSSQFGFKSERAGYSNDFYGKIGYGLLAFGAGMALAPVQLITQPLQVAKGLVSFPIDLAKSVYERQPVGSVQSLVQEFTINPYGAAGQSVGQYLVGERVLKGITTELPNVKAAYYNLERVPTEEFISPQVLEGARFPTSRTVGEATAKFEATRTETGLKLVHATVTPFGEETTAGLGSSRDVGLFVAPRGEASAAFLRISGAEAQSLFSRLFPETFLPKFPTPSFIEISTQELRQPPSSVIKADISSGVSFQPKPSTEYLVQAGKRQESVAFITPGFIKGYTPETEAVIAPGTRINLLMGDQALPNEYVSYKGVAVPILKFEITQAPNLQETFTEGVSSGKVSASSRFSAAEVFTSYARQNVEYAEKISSGGGSLSEQASTFFGRVPLLSGYRIEPSVVIESRPSSYVPISGGFSSLVQPVSRVEPVPSPSFGGGGSNLGGPIFFSQIAPSVPSGPPSAPPSSPSPSIISPSPSPSGTSGVSGLSSAFIPPSSFFGQLYFPRSEDEGKKKRRNIRKPKFPVNYAPSILGLVSGRSISKAPGFVSLGVRYPVRTKVKPLVDLGKLFGGTQ